MYACEAVFRRKHTKCPKGRVRGDPRVYLGAQSYIRRYRYGGRRIAESQFY